MRETYICGLTGSAAVDALTWRMWQAVLDERSRFYLGASGKDCVAEANRHGVRTVTMSYGGAEYMAVRCGEALTAEFRVGSFRGSVASAVARRINAALRTIYGDDVPHLALVSGEFAAREWHVMAKGADGEWHKYLIGGKSVVRVWCGDGGKMRWNFE